MPELTDTQVKQELKKAIDLVNAQRLSEARAIFNKLNEIETDDIENIVNLGWIAICLRENVDAIYYYSKASDLQPDNASHMFSLANALANAGEMGEAAAILFTCGVGASASEDGAKAAKPTYTGTYKWRKECNPLTAVFTPDGANKWTVVFTYTRGRKKGTMTGTAEGDLTTGAIKGKAERKKGGRNWTFSGTAKSGVLSCDATEVKGRRCNGTFEITAGKPK